MEVGDYLHFQWTADRLRPPPFTVLFFNSNGKERVETSSTGRTGSDANAKALRRMNGTVSTVLCSEVSALYLVGEHPEWFCAWGCWSPDSPFARYIKILCVQLNMF